MSTAGRRLSRQEHSERLEVAVFGLDPLENAATILILHLLRVALSVSLIRYVDVYERERFAVVLSMFVWGGLIATFASLHAGAWLLTKLPQTVAVLWGSAIVARW